MHHLRGPLARAGANAAQNGAIFPVPKGIFDMAGSHVGANDRIGGRLAAEKAARTGRFKKVIFRYRAVVHCRISVANLP